MARRSRGVRAVCLSVVIACVASLAGAQGAIIVDHTCTDVSKIPPYWIEQARSFAVHYAHTSHGSQVLSGMTHLESLDPNFPMSVFDAGATPPADLSACDPNDLCMYDGNPPNATYITPDLYWDGQAGIDRTESVAATGLFDFSTWTWCGQQSTNSEATVNQYLATMAAFETAHPDMRFILMTGHTDGGGATLIYNNNLVRQYAVDHDMVLFDFADIETYDPLGGGPYDNNSEGTCSWCVGFCAAHPSYCTSLPDSCAHTETNPEDRLFCKLKGQAFWWLLARLAGWSGEEAIFTDGFESGDTTAWTP